MRVPGLVVSLLASCSLLPAASFVNGQAARAVFGQQAFSHIVQGASQTLLGGASGLAWANINGTPELFVADANFIGAQPPNNRIMVFNTGQVPGIHADVSTFAGAQGSSLCPLCGFPAMFQLGQPDFNSNVKGVNSAPYPGTLDGKPVTQGYMANPTAVATDGHVLAVADTNNNRVLIWNTVPQNSSMPPDIVLGEPDFTTVQPGAATQSSMSAPQGVWIQGGKLFVADSINNRVLIWNHIPTSNNQPADIVLGQPNFTSNAKPGDTTSATQLNDPVSVTSDGTRLYVSDLGDNRVLIWNSIPTSNDQPADIVIGQKDMTGTKANNKEAVCASVGTDSDGNPQYPDRCAATLDFPRYALSDGTRLFIADGGNDRVLIFNLIPTSNGASADTVLGQHDFYSNMVTSEQQTVLSTTIDITGSVDTIPSPMSLALDDSGNLYVSDPTNDRVLIYSPGDTALPPLSIVNAASRLIRQVGAVQFQGSITANEKVTITIDSKPYTYTVKSNDTLESVTTAMINLINADGGDPNVVALTGPNPNTVFLNARNTNVGLNSISLGASPATPSSTQSIYATSSGSFLTGGNAGMLAPGALVEIDGTNLADNTYDPCKLDTSTDACQGNLPLSLGGAEVSIDGFQAPLLRVSPSQIISEVPFNFTDRDSSSVFVRTVHADGSITVTNASPINISPASPGLFGEPNAKEPRPAFAALHAPAATATVDLEGTVQAGDVATISVNGVNYSYTVQASDKTLADIITGLVNVINSANDPNVTASVGGLFNRVVLTAKNPTASVPIAVNTSTTASGKSGAAISLSPYTNATCCSNAGTGSVTPANPAVPNETITFLGTGLGVLVSGNAVSGIPYNDVEPNSVANNVNATVNNETGQVVNAGIPKGSVGIYQIQVIMPGDLPANATTAVYIAQNAFISNTVTIPVSQTPGTPVSQKNTGTLSADPNPVPAGPSGLGKTTLSWTSTSNAVEVHVNSPDGPLFAAGGSSGNSTTGPWVTNGMTFFLQDASQGNTTDPANTLASLTLHLGGASLTANPNPMLVPQGTSAGQTTLSWMAPGHSSISIFRNSTSGPLVTTSTSAYGSFTTPATVTDGTTFVLVDPTNLSNTLAQVTAHVQSIGGSITASPNPVNIVAGSPYGQTTLTWNAPTASTVEIHVNSPDGPLFASGQNTGTATTGTWVTSGMTFFLQNAGNGNPTNYSNTLATVTMQLTGDTQPTLTATPNPAAAGQSGYAQTTLSWWAPNGSALELHVGSPDGPLVAVSGPSGTATTGAWITNGTTFYLQDATSGISISPANTLATVTVGVQ